MPEVSHDPNGIIAGPSPHLVHEKITLKSGAGALTRGTVLGRINASSASVAAKAGGNTGNGALTLDGSPVKVNAQVGIYQVRCITAAENGGTFRVTDPTGDVLGDVAVGATFDNQIKFAIADGSSDFIVGDGFDVTVTATGKYLKSLAAATDGSQVPAAVLAVDVDASQADADGPAYFAGEFASEKLTYGSGHNMATCNAAFRASGRDIFIRSIGAVA